MEILSRSVPPKRKWTVECAVRLVGDIRRLRGQAPDRGACASRHLPRWQRHARCSYLPEIHCTALGARLQPLLLSSFGGIDEFGCTFPNSLMVGALGLPAELHLPLAK
jgi:hypothetical protein